MPHAPILLSGVFRWIRTSPLSIFIIFTLITILPLLGCYGEFALTKEVYRFNGDISPDSFIQSVVLWVLAFFWIYSIAIFVDVVIFNLIEFWSGNNPMVAKTTFNNPDGSQVVMTPSSDGKEVQVDVIRDGEMVDTRRIVRTSETHSDIFDSKGVLVGGVDRNVEGGLEFTRPGTERKAVLTAGMISQFKTLQTSEVPAAQ